ncbi:MAG TPA: exodeoxyribonuclease VII small subunit [Candidatus Eisenbacteria bacterium]|nr:exodeoxyribonuclease VII small subunit [Candidatus Eisenbacteria bacterium]
MSEALPECGPPGLDALLDRLEAAIGRLSDPAAPLERLVSDFEEAGRLVELAQARLDAALERVAALEPPALG